MCGFAGWFGPDAEIANLEAMTTSIAHRGPDGRGAIVIPLQSGDRVALGHRRLSIIDIDGGAQPMSSPDGRFTIAYNGEIYNFLELRAELEANGSRFQNRSDTEVILESWRRWGKSALRKFRGMFAFSLFDAERQELFLCRDHFGKKPLYFVGGTHSGRQMTIFGSEVSSLLSHPMVSSEIDPESIYRYLKWRYAPSPDTFFSKIKKVTPGSCVTISSEKIAEESFWSPPMAPGTFSGTYQQAIDEFREIFDEAVRIRLRSDVPVGAFLSSGIDSTTIVASLAQLGATDIRTFSIGYAGDPGSELALAERSAREIGTNHTSIEFTSEQLLQQLPQLTRHLGAPLAETAAIPIHLMSTEASRSVKVVLSGEGADEVFAGYPKYMFETRLGSLPNWLVKRFGLGVLFLTSPRSQQTHRIRIAARALASGSLEDRMTSWFGALTENERARFWRGPETHSIPSRRPFNAPDTTSSLGRVQYFDQTSWLPDNLLERLDTMTMAASIEARAPYMDVRLAEFAATLPDNFKVSGATTKRIVRDALGSRLPDGVLSRPKNGFRLPIAHWFRNELHDQFSDLVLVKDARLAAFIDNHMVGKMFKDHLDGSQNNDKTLWAFFALEVFLRELA